MLPHAVRAERSCAPSYRRSRGHAARRWARLVFDCLPDYAVDRLQCVRPSLQKYVVPATSGFAAEPQPLAAIYVLHRDNGATVRIQPYRGGSRALAISEHTFGRRFVAGLGMESRHFGLVSAFATRVPIVAVHRPRAPFLLDELADRIIHDLG